MAATMSALTPIADIGRPDGHVRFVPEGDIQGPSKIEIED